MTQAQLELQPSLGSVSAVPSVAGHSLETALARILPTPHSESRLQQARRIMGTEVEALSDTGLEEHLTQFQFLIDQWLDEFERNAFEGKTLRQMQSGG